MSDYESDEKSDCEEFESIFTKLTTPSKSKQKKLLIGQPTSLPFERFYETEFSREFFRHDEWYGDKHMIYTSRFFRPGEINPLFFVRKINGRMLLYAIGKNSYGSLGVGHKYVVTIPNLVVTGLTGGKKILKVCCGSKHNAFLFENEKTRKKEVYTCGSNTKGQLGEGMALDLSSIHPGIPQYVRFFDKREENVDDVYVGSKYTMFLTDTKEVWSVGSNDDGQLGLRDFRTRFIPTKVVLPEKIISVSCGGSHTFFISINGHIFATGSNHRGQLGISKHSTSIPIRIGMSSIAQIECGLNHTLFLKYNGTVFGCGSNRVNQLNQGRDIPKVGEVTNILGMNPYWKRKSDTEDRPVRIKCSRFSSLIFTINQLTGEKKLFFIGLAFFEYTKTDLYKSVINPKSFCVLLYDDFLFSFSGKKISRVERRIGLTRFDDDLNNWFKNNNLPVRDPNNVIDIIKHPHYLKDKTRRFNFMIEKKIKDISFEFDNITIDMTRGDLVNSKYELIQRIITNVKIHKKMDVDYRTIMKIIYPIEPIMKDLNKNDKLKCVDFFTTLGMTDLSSYISRGSTDKHKLRILLELFVKMKELKENPEKVLRDEMAKTFETERSYGLEEEDHKNIFEIYNMRKRKLSEKRRVTGNLFIFTEKDKKSMVCHKELFIFESDYFYKLFKFGLGERLLVEIEREDPEATIRKVFGEDPEATTRRVFGDVIEHNLSYPELKLFVDYIYGKRTFQEAPVKMIMNIMIAIQGFREPEFEKLLYLTLSKKLTQLLRTNETQFKTEFLAIKKKFYEKLVPETQNLFLGEWRQVFLWRKVLNYIKILKDLGEQLVKMSELLPKLYLAKENTLLRKIWDEENVSSYWDKSRLLMLEKRIVNCRNISEKIYKWMRTLKKHRRVTGNMNLLDSYETRLESGISTEDTEQTVKKIKKYWTMTKKEQDSEDFELLVHISEVLEVEKFFEYDAEYLIELSELERHFSLEILKMTEELEEEEEEVAIEEKEGYLTRFYDWFKNKFV
jgi:X-linked retinitis pigmentosa GTPase regulator